MSRYYGRGSFGSNNLYNMQNGYKPEGPWWRKALAMIIALVLVVLIFVVIFFIGFL